MIGADCGIDTCRQTFSTGESKMMKMSVRASLRLAVAAAFAAAACSDSVTPEGSQLRVAQTVGGNNTIVVTTSAELIAALVPQNAGQRILMQAGTYDISQPLVVPDGVTLEGEGRMLSDVDGLPAGFGSDPHATLRMTATVAGDMLTLGDGVSIKRLEIVDHAGRSGNVVAVYSRSPGDKVEASIHESEIENANAGFYGLYVQTRNLNLGNAPPPHDGAEIKVRMKKSLVTSPVGGRGLFAFNFASSAKVDVALDGNVMDGITANGGVSLPDATHDSEVRIESHGNLYRNEAVDLCAAPIIGWNLTGGSGAPVPVAVSETSRNTLRMHSDHDRIEGFTTAVLGGGGRRYFGLPLAGPSTNNTLEMELVGATLSTPSCATQVVRDFDLKGAFSASNTLVPGDGNVLRAVIRNVTGSGPRVNLYADAGGSTAPLPSAVQGIGNRLEIVGSPVAFSHANTNIDPAPGAEFFTSSH
jgi:hypothetical protein